MNSREKSQINQSYHGTTGYGVLSPGGYMISMTCRADGTEWAVMACAPNFAN